MRKGQLLPPGQALDQYNDFIKGFIGGGNYTKDEFPVAVCYTLDEVTLFMSEAVKMFDAHQVPMDQRGVSLMLGIHRSDGDYAKHKITLMMVATKWVDFNHPTQGRNYGRVESISNCVIRGGWPGVPPDEDEDGEDPEKGGITPGLKGDVGDVAYDAGSLWP